ncbi:gamma-glutamylaminecyclotransferase-like isoform X2 [Conger conger]|nr:gamma-glutamylaminecyclotransferase-like isoform X2 [Conger conger]XP_061081814.1 gamma-glutamylaminecyclotransferase-like isoform X2 [Conger conger]XP_061081815.1 gamma-glutamylaminecyclotransferase-like isoform X2 [Conger conger]XP_061081816.1 gamma-glutamylaminecyclotransferase-like isoform X2 [Conger conger]
MTRIFVYGTLKRGQPNHFRMMDAANGKAEFCGSAQTAEAFPLVIAGKYNIPFLLNVPGTGRRVRGEVYRVDAKMLAFLDDFENCPSMYQRTAVRLVAGDWTEPDGPAPGTGLEAFVYSTTAYQPDSLKLPMLENYDAYGSHGLVYALRESRQ